jgi:hypothetical protein
MHASLLLRLHGQILLALLLLCWLHTGFQDHRSSRIFTAGLIPAACP